MKLSRPITRRNVLKGLGAGLLPTVLPRWSGASPSRSRPPNVIVLLTDDQGYGDLRCLGNPFAITPNFDRLHGDSIHFTDFHVSPTCAPTRASLMTGRHCNRTGVWHTVNGRSLLRADEVTMADVFKASGYRTGIFGKWHLGDNYPFRPQDRGFEEVFIHGGGGVGQAPDYWGNDYFDDTYWRNGVPEATKGYCTDVWFSAAMDFIENHQDEPFFCYIPTNAAHSPHRAPDGYAERYDPDQVPSAEFYGMITNIDDNLGRLMAQLARLAIDDNTLLIYMTDNGTSAGYDAGLGFNAGMRENKGSVYEGGHRVPCFMRWPAANMNGGRDIHWLCSHMDILPTLIDLCGLENPGVLPMDGKSLAPLLRGSSTGWSDRALVVDNQRIMHPEKWRSFVIMTQRWRWVNQDELYDLAADPGQQHNLAGRYPEVVRNLRDEYERWWEDVSSRFDEDCEIVLGSRREPVARLSSHDWHMDQLPPWHQEHVLEGKTGNGSWAIKISRAGLYEFALHRWPRELGMPLNDAPPEGKMLNIKRAGLELGGEQQAQNIDPKDKAAIFRIKLDRGHYRLKTRLMAEDGEDRGAYYTYVSLLN